MQRQLQGLDSGAGEEEERRLQEDVQKRADDSLVPWQSCRH